jgi:hypothetical protein
VRTKFVEHLSEAGASVSENVDEVRGQDGEDVRGYERGA